MIQLVIEPFSVMLRTIGWVVDPEFHQYQPETSRPRAGAFPVPAALPARGNSDRPVVGSDSCYTNATPRRNDDTESNTACRQHDQPRSFPAIVAPFPAGAQPPVSQKSVPDRARSRSDLSGPSSMIGLPFGCKVVARGCSTRHSRCNRSRVSPPSGCCRQITPIMTAAAPSYKHKPMN